MSENNYDKYGTEPDVTQDELKRLLDEIINEESRRQKFAGAPPKSYEKKSYELQRKNDISVENELTAHTFMDDLEENGAQHGFMDINEDELELTLAEILSDEEAPLVDEVQEEEPTPRLSRFRNHQAKPLTRERENENIKLFKQVIVDGVVFKNPILVQALGLCPVLATSTTLKGAMAMGACVLFVLIMSNVIVSLLRRHIPQNVRIVSYITIIAAFVTVVEMVFKAYLPSLATTLGLFIPLIVVNCIILSRAETFASKHGVFISLVDGLSVGVGFTFAISLLGAVREIFGNGTIWGFDIFRGHVEPMAIMTMVPGGFLALGFLAAIMQFILSKRRDRA